MSTRKDLLELRREVDILAQAVAQMSLRMFGPAVYLDKPIAERVEELEFKSDNHKARISGIEWAIAERTDK